MTPAKLTKIIEDALKSMGSYGSELGADYLRGNVTLKEYKKLMNEHANAHASIILDAVIKTMKNK